ncbi:MBL fold metallo-hydrolase [Ectothiorhodospiraceae bacterium 2226]|nr:MBL fold metallo-hydrolase [Ectothiorhodospiraceae bacterium 2226]
MSGSAAPHRIHALELGPMENFVYLIEDRESGRAAIVDPAWDPARVMALAHEHGLRVTDVLLTHSHHDHINGIEQVLDETDAQLHLLKAEAEFWEAPLIRPTLHHGGDVLELGATRIELLHTPGHTPGSACFRLGNDLITGDTLFVFGCGRCDLRGGDPEQMFHTLRGLRENLPANTLLHPGHNYAERTTSTWEEQLHGNPFLHFDALPDFVHYRMREHDRHRHTPYGPVSAAEVRKGSGR